MARQPERLRAVVAGPDDRPTVPPRTGRRAAVLTALREAGRPTTAGDVARRLGVHPNTVRFHLQALLAEGRLERLAPVATTSGRPPVRYRAAGGMDPGGPRGYRMLAAMLATGYDRRYADHADPVRRATAVGVAWGRRLAGPVQGAPPSHRAAVEALVRLFRGLGFAPDQLRPGDRAPASMGLRHCPFLELVTGEDAVPGGLVCAVHLGLVRGALSAMRAPVTAPRLEPFAEPDRCVVHLLPRRSRPPRAALSA